MTQINAYLNFNGRCREAMTFYQECLGGELSLQLVKDAPIADQCPAAMQDQVLHSTLQKGQLIIMASDMVGQEGLQVGNNMGLMLNCSSDEEIDDFFEKLSTGGQVIDPLGIKFWGAKFGALVDRFGIRWMLHYDEKINKALENQSENAAVHANPASAN